MAASFATGSSGAADAPLVAAAIFQVQQIGAQGEVIRMFRKLDFCTGMIDGKARGGKTAAH
jgi:hypothetical protein